MPPSRPWSLFFVSLVLVSAPAQAGSAEISHGGFSVEVNDHGLLVGIPRAGISSVDGPRVELVGDFGEWFGIGFTGPAGRVEGVGLGRQPDWSDRTPVERVDFTAGEDRATAVARLADLEIRTDFEFDPLGPYLLVKVTFTNRGESTLRGILYSREWRETDGGGWTFPDDMQGVLPAPDDVSRVVWMPDDLVPGASAKLAFSYRQEVATAQGPDEIPLALWTDASFPTGLELGDSRGASWGDYDADGDIDIFVCMDANLWTNIDGSTWELTSLDPIIPPVDFRYGSSFADYNNDGLPDIGTEPRKDYDMDGDDENMHILKNLGGGPNFENVATDPGVLDVIPFGDSETLCWGDVNCDGYLDLFVPVYPPWANDGPGNFFLFNLGPTGFGGEYRFTEKSAEAGLDNPPGSARPEGAQFLDVDYDGDIDLYSNGTLYRNVSTLVTPSFEAMTESASGIGFSSSLEEGAMFFDYDLDGDYDLLLVYVGPPGVYIWEAWGDGMFFAAEPTIVDCPLIGLGLGMSAEDWDNDGDIDFTSRQVFRRNRLIEDGERHFTLANHSIPAEHLTSAIPAWGDWDKDGDLDCALANWGDVGYFYENTTYEPSTPEVVRRHLRVRVVGNAPEGLETQFGASVEVHVLNGPDDYRRKKFVASGHGYLNQNEYTLHFALPEDPVPAYLDQDVRLDLSVDYPMLPSEGFWRVDKYVNPVLGDLDIADLDDREIRIHRCGDATIDGVTHPPAPFGSPLLTTTTGGLALPTATTPLPTPAVAPGDDTFVGLAFNTLGATDSIRVKEILLDGHLLDHATCGPEPFNLCLWDVTDPGAPFVAAGGLLVEQTSPRNRRSHLPVDLVLPPGREFRLVARVESYRATAIAAPIDHGPIEVTGGLLFEDTDPCNAGSTLAALELATETFLALRFDPAGIGSEVADPVGNTLLLDKEADEPLLGWLDVPAASGYEVHRCSAAGGACTPIVHALTEENSYADEDATGDILWYKVRVPGTCASAGP